MATVGLRRAVTRLRESSQDFYNQVRSDFAPLQSLTLHSFASPDDLHRFQVTTDRVLGGKTDCSFSLRPYKHFTAGLFAGAVEYSDDNPSSRGGFASFRTKPDERERDLTPFAALEMRVKTDGRRYIANFKAADHSPEHLWQMAIMTEPYAWVTVAIPFAQLVLTRRGRVDIAQTPLNRERMNGFGILLADGHNGPFKFEIQWLKAVRDFNPSQYEAVPGYLLEERAEMQAKLAAKSVSSSAAAIAAGGGGSGGVLPQGQAEAEAGRQKLLEFYRQKREAAKGE